MRTAVVHDRLTGFGGAERVALVLSKAFKADIFTAKYAPDRTYPEFRNIKIREVNAVPDFPVSQVHPLVRMLDAIKFSNKKELGGYDLLFTSGEWAHFASRNNPHNIWYCYSPNRALYDLRKKIRSRYNPLWRFVFDRWTSYWVPRDQKAVKHVYKITTLSQHVALRIKKFYGRDAEVVYPPVRIDKFHHKFAEGYYLSVQRLMPEKRVDLQLKIFEHLPAERLVIVGEAGYATEYQKRISRWVERLPNIEWRSEVDDKELRDLYARCKAVIQTPLDEDFGLISVEAMASGKPCIAVDEGGFRESIIHRKTGLHVKEPYVRNFINVIENFEKYDFDPKVCLKRARDFSEKELVRKIRKLSAEMSSRQVA